MEKIDQCFLAVLRAALRGEQADPELSREEWIALLNLAHTHKVLPLILDAVHAAPSFQSLGDAALQQLRRQVRQQVMLQSVRTEEFLALNRALREAGIRPLVVKGLICRELYPKPDYRLSGDEDVLVEPELFARCCEMMTGLGLEGASQKPDDYEIPFRKPGSPLYIELHRFLFPPESEAYGHWNEFFLGAFDGAVEMDFRGSRVLTMAPAEHMLYLICHAMKHFLHSGFGIRQVCDMVLFARRNASAVDWDRVIAGCETIRGVKFAAAVFRIGEKHLEIPMPEAFRSVAVEEGAMLEDLLRGGLYGDSTLSRKHSSSITLDAAAAQKQGTRPRGALRTSLFPSAEALAGKYPYLREKPWLVPVAWCQRLWRYALETRETEDNSAAEALKIGADRVELMRQYDILD